jgi:hypothetical protein
MSELTHIMVSFQQELQKEALVRPVIEAIRKAAPGMGAGAGTGTGYGTLAGLGLGTVVGGLGGYSKAREQGASVGGAALHGLGRGVMGGVLGAGIGAGAGAAGGALAGKLRPELAQRVARETAAKPGTLGAFSRFGQRQVHQLTGWQPKSVKRMVEEGGKKVEKTIPGIEQLKGGAHAARERMTSAEAARKALGSKEGVPLTWTEDKVQKMRKLVGAGRSPEELKELTSKRVMSEHAKAKKSLPHALKAQEMGLTSFPGYVKAVREKGTEAVKAGLREQWHGGGLGTKALMVGFPAASIGGAALTPGGGAEEYGRALGSVGYTMAPFTMGGSVLAGEGLSRGLGAAGRGIDRLRGKRKRPQIPKEPSRPPASEPGDTGQATQHERHASPSMTGEIPEISS